MTSLFDVMSFDNRNVTSDKQLIYKVSFPYSAYCVNFLPTNSLCIVGVLLLLTQFLKSLIGLYSALVSGLIEA